MEVEEIAVVRTDLEEGGEQQMKEVKKDTLVADRYQSCGSHFMGVMGGPILGDIDSLVGNCHQYHHNYVPGILITIDHHQHHHSQDCKTSACG